MMVFIIRHERGNQVGCFRFKYPFFLTVNTLISWSLLSFLIVWRYIYFLESPFSNYNFVFRIFADKNFTTPNFNFVNEPDLTRILRFEIFLHMDGQLCAAYIILEYKPISSNFQSQLQQINITVPRFLTSPPPEGTHQVELPTQSVTKEEATSSHLALEEETVRVIEVLDSEEDFEVFDQPLPIKSPGATFRHLPSA